MRKTGVLWVLEHLLYAFHQSTKFFAVRFRLFVDLFFSSKAKPQDFNQALNNPRPAFSLAEAMIALLLISIILAATAPILSKRMKLTQTGFSSLAKPRTYKATFDDPTKNGTDANIFKVPLGIRDFHVTTIGGGGAGGNAIGGEIDWKSPGTYTWTVPEGVTEIETTLVSGGTGGGPGAVAGGGKGTKYANTSTGSSNQQWTTPGSYTWTVPSDAKVPALPSECTDSGVTQWTLVSDESKKVSPGGALVSVTACGGGGGGGGVGTSGYAAGLGGGGGYILNNTMALPNSTITIRVGGGGGGGGNNDSYNNWAAEMSASGYGGGGGGGEVANASTNCPSTPGAGGGKGGCGNFNGTMSGIAYAGLDGGNNGNYSAVNSSIGGGRGGNGGGNGGNATSGSWGQTGSGGGGGSYGGGGGGGSSLGGGGGGGGASGLWEATTSLIVAGGGGGGSCGGASTTYGSAGGGGGGGSGGGNGANGVLGASSGLKGPDGAGYSSSTIWGTSCCTGGGVTTSGGYKGKSGALRITWTATTNGLKCEYNLPPAPANGGSGGGAGGIVPQQKVRVTPGEVLTIVVGKGNAGGTIANPNVSYTESSSLKRAATFVLDTNWIRGDVPSGRTGSWGPYGGFNNGGCPFGSDGGEVSLGNGGDIIGFAGYAVGQSKSAGNNNSGVGCPYGDETPGGGDGGYTVIADAPDGWCKAGKGGTTASEDGGSSTGFGGCGGGGGYAGSKGGDGVGGYARIKWGGSNGGGGSSGQVLERKAVGNLKTNEQIVITVGKGGVNSTNKALGKGGDTKFGTYAISLGGNRGEDSGMGVNIHGKGGISVGAGSLAGTNGINGSGGLGGNAVHKLAAPNEGIGGCGGNVTTAVCSGFTTDSPLGKAGSKPGAGGGGGALKDKVPYKGGDGADGLVIVEWE